MFLYSVELTTAVWRSLSETMGAARERVGSPLHALDHWFMKIELQSVVQLF